MAVPDAHGALLTDIGISIIAATVLGVLAHLLRQPIILGYLIAGAIIGPGVGFKLVDSPENVRVISELGLVLLLFVIGLEMDLRRLMSQGRQLLVTGVGQFVLCVLLGLGFFPLVGYQLGGGRHEVLYLALACALSSTAIVVKLLYDRLEVDTLHGRITLGVLVIQDLFAILILAFQPNFSEPKVMPVVLALGQTAGLLASGFLFSRFVLKALFARIAAAPEMVVAVSIGWCALVAGSASAMGLSKEMGALIAGMSISAFPYSIHVTAKTLPLRDFFLTLFFISLGMQITEPTMGMLVAVPVIVVFVVASRFLTIAPLLAWTGAGRRTSFIASLNLAQISEFSLVIAMLGAERFKHIDQGLVGVLIYAMAVTSVLSSYSIQYSNAIYRLFERITRAVSPSAPPATGRDGAHRHARPVVILGFHRGARALVDNLSRRSPRALSKLLVIDFNVEVLRDLEKLGVAGLFGDISSMDTLAHAGLERAELIVSTIPDMLLKGTDNLTLVKACRSLAPRASIVATADVPDHAEALLVAGANSVLLPYAMVGDQVAALVEKAVQEVAGIDPSGANALSA